MYSNGGWSLDLSAPVSYYREVPDDITHLELSFLSETTNNVFNSILMYFECIFFPLSLGKLRWNLNYSISKSLKIKYVEVPNLILFLSLRNHRIKMIKIVYIALVNVSNMVDQGRIILQNFGLCKLSIVKPV